ncbi:MAG TPA: metallophosphoesterase family protein [Candidatus Dormibacteraeota bacterium]
MRLCVVSDIHGNLHALEAVLADARRAGADMLVVAGDLVHQGPRPAETLDLLDSLDGDGLGPLRMIRGNTDRHLLEDPAPERLAGVEWTREQLGAERLRRIAGLPAELAIGERLVVHGSPHADDHGVWPDTPVEEFDSPRWSSVLVCGHTHTAMHRREGTRHVVNGGSVAWPLDGDPRPGYAIVDDGDGDLRVELRRVDYDRGRTLAELEERGVPGREVIRHFIETASFRNRMKEHAEERLR